MKHVYAVLLAIAALAGTSSGLEVEKSNWPLKNVEAFDLKSERVGITYRIFVALPPQYSHPDSTFPAIYNLDSDITFGMMTDISRMLRLDSEVPATIVVGIAYAADQDTWRENRTRDLTPTATEYAENGGGARAFLSFIKEELVPVIDKRYRTKPHDRTLSGASYAGLFTLYALLEEPALFQRYLAAVPSVVYDDNILFGMEETFAQGRKDLAARLFISAEGSEDNLWYVKFWSAIWDFTHRLQSREYPSFRMHTEIYAGETHAQAQPRSFTTGLKYLFAGDSD